MGKPFEKESQHRKNVRYLTIHPFSIYEVVAFLSGNGCVRRLSNWSANLFIRVCERMIFGVFCSFRWQIRFFIRISSRKSTPFNPLLSPEWAKYSESHTFANPKGQKKFLIRYWDLFHSFFRIKKRPTRIQHGLFYGTLPLFVKICTIKSEHS